LGCGPPAGSLFFFTSFLFLCFGFSNWLPIYFRKWFRIWDCFLLIS
jgi:hypothetical protein